MIAMILAAGRGERLRPITDATPKALIEVNGVSLLERHLRALRAAGVDTVVINLGWLGEQIADRVGSGAGYGLNVIYSPEDDEILETGGGIFRALPVLGEAPFIVVNADIVTDMAFELSIGDDNDLAHVVLVPRPADATHGDFDIENGRVRNGDEHRAFTFSGVAVYRPEFFAACSPGRFSVVPYLRATADAGRLGGRVYDGLWSDAGTPERLAALEG